MTRRQAALLRQAQIQNAIAQSRRKKARAIALAPSNKLSAPRLLTLTLLTSLLIMPQLELCRRYGNPARRQ